MDPINRESLLYTYDKEQIFQFDGSPSAIPFKLDLL